MTTGLPLELDDELLDDEELDEELLLEDELLLVELEDELDELDELLLDEDAPDELLEDEELDEEAPDELEVELPVDELEDELVVTPESPPVPVVVVTMDISPPCPPSPSDARFCSDSSWKHPVMAMREIVRNHSVIDFMRALLWGVVLDDSPVRSEFR